MKDFPDRLWTGSAAKHNMTYYYINGTHSNALS